MPWNQISRLPPDARKIIELKRVQSILSRRTKHDKPAAIGLNAFLPSTPLAKTGRGQKIMGGAGRKCFPKKSLPKCFNPPSAEYNAQVSIKINYAFPIWFRSNRAKSGWCWTWNIYLQISSFSPPLALSLICLIYHVLFPSTGFGKCIFPQWPPRSTYLLNKGRKEGRRRYRKKPKSSPASLSVRFLRHKIYKRCRYGKPPKPQNWIAALLLSL